MVDLLQACIDYERAKQPAASLPQLQTVRFQGIDREITLRRTMDAGGRIFALAGPKVSFLAVESPTKAGRFAVLNSRGRVIGGLIERDGRLIEST